MSAVKQLLVGRPLHPDEEHGQRLPIRIGLAVFASDAISSTAYATEEILHILVPVAGMAALDDLVPISGVVMVVLAIVVMSYRQTIFAYPDGGGAYVVARENLGPRASLLAGASLLVDYTLTVAVSVSAGVAAVVSAFPELRTHRVGIALLVLAVLTYANLRGAKESGTVFAVPTYAYVVALGSLIAVGLYRSYTGTLGVMPVDEASLAAFTHGEPGGLAGFAGLYLLARAFSSGAVALTGTEAITNGVPAFREPAPRNAAATMGLMAVILGGFFLGISLLADRLRPTLSEDETILSLLGGHVFGRGSVAYLALQFTTMAILFLAANTAFADFPRLSSLIARDGYLPRQLTHRGDRLVFSNGIFLLAGFAGLLLVVFRGVTTALIPLYAVGVFTGFTVSQVGMVRHHLARREAGWRRGLVINSVGATATGLVLLVVVVSKFTTGAWIPVVVVPAIMAIFRRIHRHYDEVRAALRVPSTWRPIPRQHTVVVLLARVHRGTLHALEYARMLAPNRLVAVTVVDDEAEAEARRYEWERFGLEHVELRTLVSPYRELSRPLLELVDELDEVSDDDLVTVVIPEFVVTRWWEAVLHNQTALLLAARLRRRPNTIVVQVPLHLDDVLHGDPAVRASRRGGPARRIAGAARPRPPR
ncbi:MAG: APC family permease [Actinomycetes bacterium]